MNVLEEEIPFSEIELSDEEVFEHVVRLFDLGKEILGGNPRYVEKVLGLSFLEKDGLNQIRSDEAEVHFHNDGFKYTVLFVKPPHSLYDHLTITRTSIRWYLPEPAEMPSSMVEMMSVSLQRNRGDKTILDKNQIKHIVYDSKGIEPRVDHSNTIEAIEKVEKFLESMRESSE